MANKKLKTKKTLLKRVKITKNGKLVKKQVRMGHLKEKKSGPNKTRKSKRLIQENKGHKKIFKSMLGKHGKNI
ncbi:50S ribosomal protein L35 [Patescibacteria group bacterium]